MTHRKRKVGLTGIEPALRKELDPKSSASASSATAPSCVQSWTRSSNFND